MMAFGFSFRHSLPFARTAAALILSALSPLAAGPYSAALDDPDNPHDAPVPGFVGPGGPGRSAAAGNRVNPVFVVWAETVDAYEPAPGVAAIWSDPARALGPVSGNPFDVVALGDLDADQLASGAPPGSITLAFARPIRNYSGADFAVFENCLISAGGAGTAGETLAELAYVEVSSNGTDFVRFPSRSLTPEAVGAYGTIDPTDVYNLAGKQINGYGDSWGTPFFLEDLETHPKVLDGTVDLDAITHVRIVDIPGSGFFKDSEGNPIYDAWVTWGSGGFDLEAVGVISAPRTFADWTASSGLTGPDALPEADASGNDVPNLLVYAAGGHPEWNPVKPGGCEVFVQTVDSEAKLALRFVRDERATDLLYEVQVSQNLRVWQTIAQSTAGGPVTGKDGIQIEETSASPIASIGVLREVTVFDPVPLSASAARFLRLKVSLYDDN